MIFDSQIITLLAIVAILICASLFSVLETATVAISEHRLKVLQDKYRWAKYAYRLKQELDGVLIFSLFGNSLFNAVFTTLTTVVVASLLTNINSTLLLPLTTLVIAFFIIVFSEALPKIIASKSPVTALRIVATPLYYLFIVCKPIIWFIDLIIHSITRFLQISNAETTTAAELKAIIADKNSPFKGMHKSILLNSIDLEEITVKEVLIPLRMVEAINLDEDIEQILRKIQTTHHTQILVYEGTIDNILGYIHVKDVLHIDIEEAVIEDIRDIVRPIVFVHEFIPLIRQIHAAQKLRNRIFVVINEYGDILGIACLEDMFEIVFGDFTTESPHKKYLVVKSPDEDNQYIVDGAMLIRELNELYSLHIPQDGITLTINGLILKLFNGIPPIGACFRIRNLIFEVINVGPYWVERVKIIHLV